MGRTRTADPSARSWEALAREEPHWAVFTEERFLRRNLTQDAVREFFRSGEVHVGRILTTVREKIDPGFVPHLALDFGCGLGRVVVPLAARCDSVVGIDVSRTMLREAVLECEKRGIANARLLHLQELSDLRPGSFDFLHAYIVFQHILPRRGEAILAQLLELLAPRGVAVLHFSYSEKRRESWLRTRVRGLWEDLKSRFVPLMRMHEYDLNRIFRLMQEHGAERLHVEFTDHDFYGVLVYFQKKHPAGSVAPGARS